VLPDTPAPDIPNMTKAQLLDYAKSAGISGVGSTMKKADIVAKIEEAF